MRREDWRTASSPRPDAFRQNRIPGAGSEDPVRQSSRRTAPLAWRKSSYSAYNGSCVEVATAGDQVLVRDSKNPGGPVLAFTAGEWRAFLLSLPASPPAA